MPVSKSAVIKKDTHSDLGFFRVGVAVPEVKVGDIQHNTEAIIKLARQAASNGVELVVFPELVLTGYTIGDLIMRSDLLAAVTRGLSDLATANIRTTYIVGAPLEVHGKLYNTAVVIQGRDIIAAIPKINLPNHDEFYERRWFVSGRDVVAEKISIAKRSVTFGSKLAFSLGKAVFGVELCEDLWAPIPPSSSLALVTGANIIANLSASNQLVGKREYRHSLIVSQSGRLSAAYILASAGKGESTQDTVFSGYSAVAELTKVIAAAENKALIMTDIDLDRLAINRRRNSSYRHNSDPTYKILSLKTLISRKGPLLREISPTPFIEAPLEAFAIQVAALKSKLKHSNLSKTVLGLSGGLDSTLTLLVAVTAFQELRLPLKNIICCLLPTTNSSVQTKHNAVALIKKLKISSRVINVSKLAEYTLDAIKHRRTKKDLTYENNQARIRTLLLLDIANDEQALMLGTGDMSEIALGWNTYGGDHLSHYNVNVGVPKTLVKVIVSELARTYFISLRKELDGVLSTPISPELQPSRKGQPAQITEEIVGPYEVIDFFLYYYIYCASSRTKTLELAKLAFKKRYTVSQLQLWFSNFKDRFFRNQWKRSVSPDGPKVMSFSLSPRADWRSPPDVDFRI